MGLRSNDEGGAEESSADNARATAKLLASVATERAALTANAAVFARAVAAAEVHLPGVPHAVIKHALRAGYAALPVDQRDAILTQTPPESPADSAAVHPAVAALQFIADLSARDGHMPIGSRLAVAEMVARAATLSAFGDIREVLLQFAAPSDGDRQRLRVRVLARRTAELAHDLFSCSTDFAPVNKAVRMAAEDVGKAADWLARASHRADRKHERGAR